MMGLLPTTGIFLATAPRIYARRTTGWRSWCARAWDKTRLVAVCMFSVIAEGIESRSFSGNRGDIGCARAGSRKALFDGLKRRGPARATDARNSSCCWGAST